MTRFRYDYNLKEYVPSARNENVFNAISSLRALEAQISDDSIDMLIVWIQSWPEYLDALERLGWKLNTTFMSIESDTYQDHSTVFYFRKENHALVLGFCKAYDEYTYKPCIRVWNM